jgi:hypothetical protein
MIKIHDIDNFTAEIERRVQEHQMEYLEAIVSYMNETGLDEVKIKKLISPTIKHKLEEESDSFNRLGKRQKRFKDI